MSTHVIHWRNKQTARSGAGRTKYDESAAQALAMTLNRDYPDIEHVAVLADSPLAKTFDKPAQKPPPPPSVDDWTDITVMMFGEHKGKMLGELPSDYLDWLAGQTWLATSWPKLDAYIRRNRRAIDKDLNLE